MFGPDAFAGGWRMAREIADFAGGPDGHLVGRARFVPQGESRLVCLEAGLLRPGGGARLRARRRYLWDFGPEGVAVRFDDGRPFHRFAPGVSGPGSDHPCGADLYRVTYDFDRWPDWTVCWRVTGPRKNYRMTTRYSRC